MRQRFRKRYMFWLDLNNPYEDKIAEMIEHLHEARTFSQTIRDGIRLVVSLRAGKLEVLFELFPWIQHSITTHTPESREVKEFTQLLTKDVPSAFVDSAPADPAESRANFASGLGNLFDDDEDF